MSFKTISALKRGLWAIELNYALNSLHLVSRLFKGEPVSFTGRPAAFDDDEISADAGKNLMVLQPEGSVYKASRYRSFNEAPKGSLALIPVNGPLLKYGGDCGEPGAVHMTQWVRDAREATNIVGAIFDYDTPGGQVDGTQTLADEIKNFGKPNVAIINDGMMASAGMWLGSSNQKIYATHKTCAAGSIGVMCSFYTFMDYFEKEGIKLHQIYAPQSSEKNADFKDALKGDYKLIEEELKFICDQFISTIKTNRGDRLKTGKEDPFKGAMYFAEEATEIGLIDGIKSMDEIVDELSWATKK